MPLSERSQELLFETLVVVVLSVVSFALAHWMAPMPTDASLVLLLLALLVPVLLLAVVLGRKLLVRAGGLEIGVGDPLPDGLPKVGDDADIPALDPASLLTDAAGGPVDPAKIDAASFTPGVLRLEVGRCTVPAARLREIAEGFGSHGLRSVLFTREGKCVGQMTPYLFHRLACAPQADASRFFQVLAGKDPGPLQHDDLVTARLPEDATLGDALRHLNRNRLRTCIVVDGEGRPRKVLDQDVLHSHLLAGAARA